MIAPLAHVRNWIFDLDNTLYPAASNLFARIDARMTAYVGRVLGVGPDAALAVQKRYFHEHGTTVAGLMAHHAIDPHDFLEDVHAIELDVLDANAPLAAAIARLPGRKLVFTNGDAPYAVRVLDRLGLAESFEGVHDIHAMGLVPKPAASAYAGLCAAFALDPAVSLFADDMARNLAPAKAIGMTTLWVDNGSEQGPADTDTDTDTAGAAPAFIDHRCTDLTDWLHDILEDA